jgi:hypothetical protein
MTHISLHFDSAVAKAVRIQAINEGVSLKAWITEAIMRQLVAEETALRDVDLVRQELPKQAGKTA